MITQGATARAAEFVREFFIYLEKQGIPSAVLHGGADGFERDLSDVDFAVDQPTFGNLPVLISDYCTQSGWRLCQILRHETTAAYCVCSAVGEPACTVALDACSDYQRNGTVFLTAEDLLENRRRLPWGGHGLSLANELRYRFAKAAAKNKNVCDSSAEFALYPEDVRSDCAAWLKKQWGVLIRDWTPTGLAPALAKIKERSNSRPTLLQAGAIDRMVSRVHHPTGLVVFAGPDDFEATAVKLKQVFSHLYFRRFRKADRWSPALLKDLVASTLIVVPKLSFPWSRLLPPNCIHHLKSGQDAKEQHEALAAHLAKRCKEQEKL
jgi:hypothetical protein